MVPSIFSAQGAVRRCGRDAAKLGGLFRDRLIERPEDHALDVPRAVPRFSMFAGRLDSSCVRAMTDLILMVGARWRGAQLLLC